MRAAYKDDLHKRLCDYITDTNFSRNGQSTDMPMLKKAVKFWLDAFFALRALIALRRLRQPSLVILTYHRVLAEDDSHRLCEQPGMIVSPGHLRNHIAIMESLGAVPMFLDDWLEQQKQSPENLPRLAFAVTFDDGWRDNFTQGLPVLREKNTPATIFLVSDFLDTKHVFWPEQILHLLTTVPPATVKRCLPGTLDWLGDHTRDFRLGERKLSIEEADKVINRLKTLDDFEINEHLKKTFNQCPELQPRAETPYILQAADIDALVDSELIRFGAHTRNHARLNRLQNIEQLKDEVVNCKRLLEERLKNPVGLFCYPNGDITPDGERLVEAHYTAACTTETGLNRASTSPFKLRRLNLHDGNARHALGLLATLGKGKL